MTCRERGRPNPRGSGVGTQLVGGERTAAVIAAARTPSCSDADAPSCSDPDGAGDASESRCPKRISGVQT